VSLETALESTDVCNVVNEADSNQPAHSTAQSKEILHSREIISLLTHVTFTHVQNCYIICQYKYQLSLMNPRDVLHHGKRAANKDGRSV